MFFSIQTCKWRISGELAINTVVPRSEGCKSCFERIFNKIVKAGNCNKFQLAFGFLDNFR